VRSDEMRERLVAFGIDQLQLALRKRERRESIGVSGRQADGRKEDEEKEGRRERMKEEKKRRTLTAFCDSDTAEERKKDRHIDNEREERALEKMNAEKKKRRKR
jgi:hypothetical protein